MIIPIDKKKIVDEFKLKYVEKRYEEEVPKIYDRFYGNKENIKDEIITKFNKVCTYAGELQDKELKGSIRYIYISFLRTSIIENKGIYRIDLYDNNWFLDKEECFIDIDLDFIYEGLFSYINELYEKKKEYKPNITDIDIERIKFDEANKYNTLTIKILKSMISDFFECTGYKNMKKDEDIMIFAGDYRDEAILLYKNN